MLATTMTEARSPEDKLRWAFRLYDKDGSGVKDKSFHIFHSYATQNLTIKIVVTFSGTIDSEEMTEIITNLCSLEGLTQVGGVNNFDLFDKCDLGGVYYLHVC